MKVEIGTTLDRFLRRIHFIGDSWQVRYQRQQDTLQEKLASVEGLPIDEAEKRLGITETDTKGYDSGYYRIRKHLPPEVRERAMRKLLEEKPVPPSARRPRCFEPDIHSLFRNPKFLATFIPSV